MDELQQNSEIIEDNSPAPDAGEGDDLRSMLEQLYDEGTDAVDEDAVEGGEEKGEEQPAEQQAQEAAPEAPQLPPEAINYIQALEVERDIAGQFKAAIEPHFDFIQEFNINPYQHVQELLGVSRTLATGDAASKAGMIANLCDMFKVDVEELDNALFELQNRPKPSKEDLILDKLNALEQRAYAPPTQVPATPINTNELQNEINAFAAKNEFFNEVKGDMAVFLNSGKARNLDEAYALAIKINDGVQNTIRARNEKTTKAAKAGQVSLRGAAPTSTPKGGGDLRSVLEQFWDENE